MTKYISTMTEEEIAAWMRAPGAAAARPATAGNGKSLLEEIESRPRAPRPAPPPRPAQPYRPARRSVPAPPPRPDPATAPIAPYTQDLPPCRFCGEPSTVEDRCSRHDELWQRLSGKQAADLQAIADRAP
jgi:hypothetical protein